MEMIMSTIALWPAEAATPAVEANPRPGFFQRLIKAREKDARRRTHAFLAAQPDQRLLDLGYTAKDIQELRQGRFKLPGH
jgi:hypothetical protein